MKKWCVILAITLSAVLCACQQKTIQESRAESMEEAMETHTDVAGVFCTNADTSDLYLELEKDGEQPAFIGVDATTKQQEALRPAAGYTEQHHV